ncbi:MAG: ATP-dependent helicase [Treponema sp.]|jgi:DNA helicase-2/ATP-dependent DNA helicase PcrA|nr:ATP-dependent helicase [Treponema sp.]
MDGKTTKIAPYTETPYLEALNNEQREAVFHWERPLLILAGAGSGKTRVITTKIAYLIRERGLDPRSILAVTFTNKAAREMADRARLIDERAGEAMLRTFHSFGAWFLRRNGALAGLDSSFVIYDDDDMVSLLSTIEEDIPKPELRLIAGSISRAKDYFFSPDSPELDRINYHPRFRKIYARYEEKLRQIGNVDFGDLIKKPVEILRENEAVSSRIQDRFRVILVDEYQDANIAQFELLKELAGPASYVCVVGDDDQSIYRFRGAEVRNILEFPDRFRGADIIRLQQNYRSTTNILRLASSVVAHNESRLGKELFSRRGEGKKPVLAFLPSQDEEAAFCADLVEKSVNPGAASRKTGPARYSDWAILYRTNAQSLGFETEFLRRGIPYRVVGTLKFYEREEIKDALALLSFLVNSRDEIAFRRVVNKPARGLGKATVDRIVETAADGISGATETPPQYPAGDLEAAARLLLPELPPKARSGLREFLTLIEEGRALITESGAAAPPGPGESRPKDGRPPAKGRRAENPESREELRGSEGLSALVVKLVTDSGLANHYRVHEELGAVPRLNNLQELANAAVEYPATMAGLLQFLENIELDRSLEDNTNKQTGNTGDTTNSNNTVTLITFHNTKGLEFRHVIMTGIEQGVFPREDKKGEDLEEERRLFYVGATRAMDELYLVSCAQRRMYGRTQNAEPSIFLREVDNSTLRVIGASPYKWQSRGADAAYSSPGAYDNSGTSPGAYGSSGAYGNPGASPGDRDSQDWRRGDRLYHDDYGYGGVLRVRETEDGPVVEVLFESGKELRFLSRHQGSAFTRIGNEV